MDPLTRLAQTTRSIEDARLDLIDFVDEARDAGATWQAIGDALGMTRQSAHARFGDPDPDPEQVAARRARRANRDAIAATAELTHQQLAAGSRYLSAKA